jgi:hypothetical protein
VTHQIPEWIFIAFIAITAIGVLLQAIAMLGILFALKEALKQVKEASTMAETYVVPAMASAKRLIDEVSPKVKVAAENAATLSQKAIEISERVSEASQHVAEVTGTLREQSVQVSATVTDLLKKTEAQAERIDGMVTGTLDSIATATAAWQRVVAGPLRQANAVLNGLRAGLGVFRGREREAHAAADGDHFV